MGAHFWFTHTPEQQFWLKKHPMPSAVQFPPELVLVVALLVVVEVLLAEDEVVLLVEDEVVPPVDDVVVPLCDEVLPLVDDVVAAPPMPPAPPDVAVDEVWP